MSSERQKRDKLTTIEWIFILGCFIFYVMWAIQKPLGYGPDETMRYDIPLFIYQNGCLPNGYTASIRSEMWGYSYAFYPYFLGPICSFLLMKAVSVLTTDPTALLFAARMVSAAAGALTVLFAMKIAKRLFAGAFHWLLPVSVGMIPQFVFLSSYVNNDILCVCGSSIIIYAWIRGIQYEWDFKNGVLLAVGIVTVTLTYYNGYGWILCSIFVFGFCYIKKVGRNRDIRNMWRVGFFLSGIVLLCISYFFIRNGMLYDGDILGMDALAESSQQYGAAELKPSNRMTAYNMGDSVWKMIFGQDERIGKSWARSVWESFVGEFKSVSLSCPAWVYCLYKVFFLTGLFGTAGAGAAFLCDPDRRKNRGTWIFILGMFIGTVIPVILSIYYSYRIDFQPQGRYCYPMVLGLLYFVCTGWQWILGKFPVKSLKEWIAAGGCMTLITVTLYIYQTVYVPS